MSASSRNAFYLLLIVSIWCTSCATKPPSFSPVGHYGLTKLMYATTLGQSNVVESLLAKVRDKNVDERDWIGRTPLMFAAQTGQVAIVNILLAHGAHPNSRDDYGWTALALAAERGHVEIVNQL